METGERRENFGEDIDRFGTVGRSVAAVTDAAAAAISGRHGPFLKRCQPPWRALAVLLLVVNTDIALAGSAVYTYDSLGRLSQVTYSNGVVVTYTYDAAGNRITQVITGAQ